MWLHWVHADLGSGCMDVFGGPQFNSTKLCISQLQWLPLASWMSALMCSLQ